MFIEVKDDERDIAFTIPLSSLLFVTKLPKGTQITFLLAGGHKHYFVTESYERVSSYLKSGNPFVSLTLRP